MSKDIPEIDDLTRGINDSELILTQDTVGTQVEQRENNNIHGRCRSDLVNAIVRAFFKSYLPRLAEYRREKKSLFNSYNL